MVFPQISGTPTTETSVRYVVDFVLYLDNQMLKFVFSKKHVSRDLKQLIMMVET